MSDEVEITIASPWPRNHVESLFDSSISSCYHWYFFRQSLFLTVISAYIVANSVGGGANSVPIVVIVEKINK